MDRNRRDHADAGDVDASARGALRLDASNRAELCPSWPGSAIGEIPSPGEIANIFAVAVMVSS